MRVICFNRGNSKDEDYIQELNTYTVLYAGATYNSATQTFLDFYSLRELSGVYLQSLFLPLSNICEIELLNQRNNNP